MANGATDPDPIASPATVPYARLFKLGAQAPAASRSSTAALLFSLRGAAAETVTVDLFLAEASTFEQNADGTLNSVAATKYHLIKSGLVVTANVAVRETVSIPPRGVVYVRMTADTIAADRELLIQHGSAPRISDSPATAASIFGALLHAEWVAEASYITEVTGVSSWLDTTGTFDLVEGTGTKQPIFSASAGPNSTGEVDFDGSNDHLDVNVGRMVIKGGRPCMLIIGAFDVTTEGADGHMATFSPDDAPNSAILTIYLKSSTNNVRFRTRYDNGGGGATEDADWVANDTDNHAFDIFMYSAGHTAELDGSTLAGLSSSAGAGAQADQGTGQTFALGGQAAAGGKFSDCRINHALLLNDQPTAEMVAAWYALCNTRYGKSL